MSEATGQTESNGTALNRSNSSTVNKAPLVRFTAKEDQQIEEGYRLFNGNWEQIISNYEMNRSVAQIKRRFSRLKKKPSINRPESGSPPSKKAKVNPPEPSFSVVESLESSMDSSHSEFHSPISLTSSRGMMDTPTAESSQESTETLKEMLIDLSIFQMKELQQKVLTDRIRLGEIISGHYGRCAEGKSFLQLNERQQIVERKKEQIDKQKKQIKIEQTKLAKQIGPTNEATEEQEEKRNSLLLRAELNRCNATVIRKEETEINNQREKLNAERQLHYYQTKLVEEHNHSVFSDYRVLCDRYLLLNLLGKGGFSHVYAAFDLHRLIKVACKIHQPDPSWSIPRKKAYVTHATRECKIQKAIDHQRVVGLYDVFLIEGEDSFCTILEYCNDGDLDLRLRMQHKIPEKETRCIIMQVVDAMSYLSQQEKPIIHYDLKPGNILFHDGEVKITDFGLSKIMDDRETGGIDLTSQGAGTYWYLPPECFDTNSPRISSKVDVWSIGVLCYQMLFGKKPFADKVPALQIMQKQMINSALKVEFPTSVKISNAAMNFIKQCLIPDQDKRPSITKLAVDPFIKLSSR